MKRRGGNLAAHIGPVREAQLPQLTIQGHSILHMTEHESYRYLGVLINLELDWTEQWSSLMEKVTEEAHLINSCGAIHHRATRLHLANTVMRPAIRYSMSVVPYTWDRIQGLHSVLMNCARKACGLSKRASTLLMMKPREEFGVGGREHLPHLHIHSLRCDRQPLPVRGRQRTHGTRTLGGVLIQPPSVPLTFTR